MSRYSISGNSTVVGTTLRAGASVYAVAGSGGRIREVQVYNTTATSFYAAVARFTAATNVGAGLTEAKFDPNSPAAACTGFAGHTGDSTAGEEICRGPVGAAIGAGIIWTFDSDTGLVLPAGTANGIGILCPTGTGQIFSYVIVWDE